MRILTKRNNSQLYKHNPQPISMYITQNKCYHIKSDTKMALRDTNSWFLQHPLIVYFATGWTTLHHTQTSQLLGKKFLATMQDFLITRSFTVMFKVLFQERFSIKCHLPIVPSRVTTNPPIWLRGILSHIKRGRGQYLPHLHTFQLFHFKLLEKCSLL